MRAAWGCANAVIGLWAGRVGAVLDPFLEIGVTNFCGT